MKKDIDFLGFYNRNKLFKDINHQQIKFLAILDINEFYFINYHYSEKVGNKLLKEIGKKIENHFKMKKIYRSGDRFICYFKN